MASCRELLLLREVERILSIGKTSIAKENTELKDSGNKFVVVVIIHNFDKYNT